ncbi:MAG: LptE family protein [Bacteroidales bacterium]|nr:LptE family protein [Bacteroidales bacterium]
MNTVFKPGFYFTLVFILLSAPACKMNYSFTGASIPPGVKTIQIENFPNNALLINPTLSQDLTDALRNKFLSQTNLSLVNQGGDLVITGEITDFNTRPTAIQANDIAALNRLTITIKVSFVNNIDKTQSFQNQSFSRFEEYPSTQDLLTVQDVLVKQINEQLVEDIFNKTVVNW